ncbi:MAG: hypothetical protein CSA97_04355, partial [Bacteroidetes bacterium]
MKYILYRKNRPATMAGGTVRQLLYLMVTAILLAGGGNAHAQQSDEFWFDVPEVGRLHEDYEPELHVTSLDSRVVTLEIRMPALNSFSGGLLVKSETLNPGETKSIPLKEFVNQNNRENSLSSSNKWCVENVLEVSRSEGVKEVGATYQPFPSTENIPLVLNRTRRGLRMTCRVLDTIWLTTEKAYQNLLTERNNAIRELTPSDPNYARDLNIAMSKFYEARRLYTSPKLYKLTSPQPAPEEPLVSAYLYLHASTNSGMMVLKGRNAKGKNFVLPMPNKSPMVDWTSDPDYEYNYASFNITATEDHTTATLKIKPTKSLYIRNVSVAGGSPLKAKRLKSANGEYKLHFAEAGQSSIIVAYPESGLDSDGYRLKGGVNDFSLAGAIIESDKPVVVTMKMDDVSEQTNARIDYVVDQLVPTGCFGQSYAVTRGTITSDDATKDNPPASKYWPTGNTKAPDFAFVVGTVNNTTVQVLG